MLLWEKRNTNGFPDAVALDGSGNVIITGIWYPDRNNWASRDCYTAKYAAGDGTLLWEKQYDGPWRYDDYGVALTVDSCGDVVVTGASCKAVATNGYILSICDLCTVKYAAADGALLWEQRHTPPANGYARAKALALDASDNVAVTGYSHDGTNSDYYTAKYRAADGALLWERRYDSSSNGNDQATALAVDSDGNVIVTGYSVSRQPNYAISAYTAKYAGTDGSVLWEMRYGGSESNYAGAAAIGVDAKGNVVITGSSHSRESDVDYDYFTAKYAGADGAFLWERRYNGPANGNDWVGGLALRPDGTVAITGESSGSIATVVYREVLPAVSIDLVPTGVRLRFTGESGRAYRIERAPTVTGPWSTIATLSALEESIDYLEEKRPEGTAFYRISTP